MKIKSITFSNLRIYIIIGAILSIAALSVMNFANARPMIKDDGDSGMPDFIPEDPACITAYNHSMNLFNTAEIDPLAVEILINNDLESYFTKQLIRVAMDSGIGERTYFNGTHYASTRLRKFVRTIHNSTHFYDGNYNVFVDLQGRKNYDCDDYARDLELYLQNSGITQHL